MSFWEWLTDFIDRRSGPYRPPESSVPEYDRPPQGHRPHVRLTRPRDDAEAEEALRVLQEYVRGVRSERDWRPPRR